MKITLIDPPYGPDEIVGRSQSVKYVINTAPALGLAYLAAVLLEDGHQVQIIDGSLGLGLERICELVREQKPQVIGITANTASWPKAQMLARRLKTELPRAIRVLGASPIRKLVLPKVMATLIMLPLLTMLAIAVGILGGMIISVYELSIGGTFYWVRVLRTVGLDDLMSGLGKTFFFAIFISTIACYNGLNARGGADGVGRATTRTVVLASISVLVSDFFLTKLFLAL